MYLSLELSHFPRPWNLKSFKINLTKIQLAKSDPAAKLADIDLPPSDPN